MRRQLGILLLLVVADLVYPQERPNVVVFLADDAGWGDYGHSGNRLAATPHVDSLARDGVSLERFFVCPVCSPTRAEFLTGRYHPRGGVRGVSTGLERLNLDERTIAEAFQQAGYATGAFGKWHNGTQWPYHPRARGFDQYFGHTSGHWGEYFNPPLENNEGLVEKTQGYIVDICTDRALQFLDQQRGRSFFCYIPFTTPHSPWAAPKESWEQFRNQPLTQRASNPDQEVVDQTRCAMAMLANQDQNVGRVLRKLEELKVEDNTIIVYFSDNGPNSARWNGAMKGRKGSTDEGGIRSVCYWRWLKGLPRGKSVSQIAGAIDLLPTLTSLAGIPRVGDKPLDGRDLSPLLKNQVIDWPERMLFTHWNRSASVRTQTHRLDSNGKLFDMVADPGQTQPINDHAEELAASLQQAVTTWKKEVLGPSADPRPIPVGYREFPHTLLPARDAEPRGQVRRSSSAPNSSYFVNWTSTDDRIEWLVDVKTSGSYRVMMDYTCREQDVGSTVCLSVGDRQLVGKITIPWDPPLHTDQDTLPRPAGESKMKDFRSLTLGEMDLVAGEGKLVLRALEIPGSAVVDLRRVILSLLP
jgi:arylsulfatase A-like enzyme